MSRACAAFEPTTDVTRCRRAGASGGVASREIRTRQLTASRRVAVSHGWTVRGDLANPAVARDVAAAFADAIPFLAKYLK